MAYGRVVPPLAVGVFGLLLGLAFGKPIPDDAWITYRVAENLAAGVGFVYNAGEHVLIATSPLQTLVLAGVHRLGVDLSVAGVGIGVLAATIGGILVYLIGCRAGVLAGLTAGLFFSAYPFLPSVYAMETPLELCLALAAVYAYLRERVWLAALLLGLATLARMDVVLLAGILSAHWIWTRRSFPAVPLMIYAATIIPWFIFSVLYFGALFPATLAVKVAQGQQGWEQYFPDRKSVV